MSVTPSPQTHAVKALYDEALRAYHAGSADVVQALAQRILELNHDHVGAIHLQGLLALASGQTQAAREWLERAIAIEPQPILHNTLYAILLKLGDFDGAVDSLRCGLAIQPDFATLHYNLALPLQQFDRLEEAAVSYRRAIECDSRNSSAYNNLGRVFCDLGQLDEAERHYRRAIELAPENLVARNNLAMLLLATGRYDEAWPDFEYRWVSFRDAEGRPARIPVEVPLPRWSGEAAFTSALAPDRPRTGRLLVLHEQGLGDSLQFVRYLPMLLERFAEVGYVCPPPLRSLYEQSLRTRWPALVLLDSVPADLHAWTCFCPLMSLPMALGTRVATIPSTVPYLHADPGRCETWRARLQSLPEPKRPRVGVVWAGGHSALPADRHRSLAFAQIAPLLALQNVHWISLQKTDDPDKRADFRQAPRLLDWSIELTDFADTAALVVHLDLVISVDTSVAHLAAAMGKPVWLLNRFSGCWRWLYGRDDSPWYPGLRVFTQQQRGNWDEVLGRVATELRRVFPARGH